MTFEQWIITILAVNTVFTWAAIGWLLKRVRVISMIISAIGNLAGLTTGQIVHKIHEITKHRKKQRRANR